MKKLKWLKNCWVIFCGVASEQLLFTWNIVFGDLNRVKTKSEFLSHIPKFHARKETILTNQEEFFYIFFFRASFSVKGGYRYLLDKLPSTG